MSQNKNSEVPTRQFLVVSSIALAWNLIGIITYLMTVTISTENLNAMSVEERALYSEVPLLISISYAIAVFGGTLGCILLILRKTSAIGIFFVSLIAICIQMGHGLFFTSLLQTQGASAAILPILVVGIAAFLLWYSMYTRRQRWII